MVTDQMFPFLLQLPHHPPSICSESNTSFQLPERWNSSLRSLSTKGCAYQLQDEKICKDSGPPLIVLDRESSALIQREGISPVYIKDFLTSIFRTRFLSSKIVRKPFQRTLGGKNGFIGIMKKGRYPLLIVSTFLDRASKSFQFPLSFL
jgi:hypothetical protein